MKTQRRVHSICSMTLLILTLLLSACGRHEKRVAEMKAETGRLAQEINQVFVTARENLAIRAKLIQDAYEHKDRYDLSTKGMDVSEGGDYKWFEDWYYIPVKDKFQGKGMISVYNGNKGLYLDPEVEYRPENFSKARKIAKDGPEIELLKQEMRLWEQILVNVMEAGERIGYTEYAYFANIRGGLQIHSMYLDYASVASPNLTQEIMGSLEWVKLSTPYGNPDGTPKWTAEAFARMAGEGWGQDVAMPVYAQGSYVGLSLVSLYPLEISEKLFKHAPQKLMFLGSSASLLGVSKAAKAVLDVKELHDFDYVEQMKNNAFVADEFKLTYESQKPGVQALGKKILAGEKAFEVAIDGKSYTVVVADIPEVKFYVVGLVEK